MKKIIILLITIFTLVSCNNAIENNKNKTEVEKINITTSIVPLASISNYIGGEFVDVKSLVPSGVSPHGFDLTPNKMVDLEKSDLIVQIGLEHIDGFLEKAIENKNNILSLKDGIELLDSTEDDHDEDNEEEHHDEHGIEKDPHIWNSFTNSKIMAENISKKLTEIQPKHKDIFEQNLLSFNKQLDKLRSDYEEKIKGKKQNKFINFHDAYNYLFKDLSIDEKNKLIFRSSILSEPNSVEMKELIDNIKRYNVKVAFVEPQFKDSTLLKIAKEYNIQIITLDPLGMDTSKKGFMNNFENNLNDLEKIYE